MEWPSYADMATSFSSNSVLAALVGDPAFVSVRERKKYPKNIMWPLNDPL
jgi:hypothetical protein